jgi:hypothetical protein
MMKLRPAKATMRSIIFSLVGFSTAQLMAIGGRHFATYNPSVRTVQKNADLGERWSFGRAIVA